MPRFRTNLLIRDNRPQLFAAAGATVHTRTLTDAEFAAELRNKLIEEAQEAATAPTENLTKELADVLEILQTLAAHHGISMQDVEAQMHATRAKLGGFEHRIFSESIEAPEDNETTTYHRQYPHKYPEIQE